MTKNVLIEGHNLVLPRGTGIATYARHLTTALRTLGCDVDLLFSTDRPIARSSPEASEISLFDAMTALPPSIFEIVLREIVDLPGYPTGLKSKPVRLSGLVLDPRAHSLSSFNRLFPISRLPDAAKAHFKRYGKRAPLRLDVTPDLFHATSPMPVTIEGCPNIYTIHDLVPIRLPQTTLDEKTYTLRMLKHLAQRADHIVTVSEHSKRDIVQYLGIPEERVTNTYQSVVFPSDLTAKSDADIANELAAGYGLDFKEYFLYVGAIEPKKNLGRLLDAYRTAGSKRPLIVVGAPAWQFEGDMKKLKQELFPTYKQAGDEFKPVHRIRHLEYLPLADVVNLMRGARALFFPSIYEGFGLPVVEGMLLGTAVMTSNVSCLPEIAGDAAVYVDPTDVSDIGRSIRILDHDDGLIADLVAKGTERAKMFGPEPYQERLKSLYARLM